MINEKKLISIAKEWLDSLKGTRWDMSHMTFTIEELIQIGKNKIQFDKN